MSNSNKKIIRESLNKSRMMLYFISYGLKYRKISLYNFRLNSIRHHGIPAILPYRIQRNISLRRLHLNR